MTYTWQIRSACVVVVLTAVAGPLVWALVSRPPAARIEAKTPTDASQILAELEAGNSRFIASRRVQSIDTSQDAAERLKLVKGQHPLVALLTCADSRIVPEFVFDQCLGSIFVLRNAGNVVDEDGLGTLEYAVEHLHIPLVIVMGHKGCGAIQAMNEAGDRPLPHHLRDLQMHMAGLKADLKPQESASAFLAKLSEENAKQQAALLLTQSDVLRQAVKEKQLLILAALYDMETGAVTFFDKNVKAK